MILQTPIHEGNMNPNFFSAFNPNPWHIIANWFFRHQYHSSPRRACTWKGISPSVNLSPNNPFFAIDTVHQYHSPVGSTAQSGSGWPLGALRFWSAISSAVILNSKFTIYAGIRLSSAVILSSRVFLVRIIHEKRRLPIILPEECITTPSLSITFNHFHYYSHDIPVQVLCSPQSIKMTGQGGEIPPSPVGWWAVGGWWVDVCPLKCCFWPSWVG